MNVGLLTYVYSFLFGWSQARTIFTNQSRPIILYFSYLVGRNPGPYLAIRAVLLYCTSPIWLVASQDNINQSEPSYAYFSYLVGRNPGPYLAIRAVLLYCTSLIWLVATQDHIYPSEPSYYTVLLLFGWSQPRTIFSNLSRPIILYFAYLVGRKPGQYLPIRTVKKKWKHLFEHTLGKIEGFFPPAAPHVLRTIKLRKGRW
jgi:hypothetical protein